MTHPYGLVLGPWVLAVSACSLDPVHAAAVVALGPEDPTVPVGQYHRKGQPCVVCHSPEGPAKMVFSVAGTIFYGPPSPGAEVVGVNQATVNMVDDTNDRVQVTTNCVGNFFTTPNEFSSPFPMFPMEVSVQLGNASPQKMTGHIGREPSCASCHEVNGNPGVSNVGHVFLVATVPSSLPPCPVSPVVGGS